MKLLALKLKHFWLDRFLSEGEVSIMLLQDVFLLFLS